MQTVWNRVRDLVRRQVSSLFPPRLTKDQRLWLQLRREQEKAEIYRAAQKRLEAEIQKTWQEQGCDTVLPNYVYGIDPYQPRDWEVDIWPLGGEHRPHLTEGEVSKLSYREAKHPDSYMGGAHNVRQFIDEAGVWPTTRADAKYLGDSATAFGHALQFNERKRKAAQGLEGIPEEE